VLDQKALLLRVLEPQTLALVVVVVDSVEALTGFLELVEMV